MRSAQDDGFVEGLKQIWWRVRKAQKIEKVTASQDDDFAGKNPNKLALMGASPRRFRPTYALANVGHPSRGSHSSGVHLRLRVHLGSGIHLGSWIHHVQGLILSRGSTLVQENLVRGFHLRPQS